MKKILLIQPFRKPSLREIMVKNYPCWEIINTSPLILAAVLEKGGYQVDFLSMQNIFKSYEENKCEKLYELLGEYEPDYVIFHTDYYIAFTSTAVFYSIKIITEFYKKKNKNIKNILVGRNGLALKEKVFAIDDNIDVVVKGECEEIILDIFNEIDRGEMSKVPCVLYKEEKKVIENKGCAMIENFDQLPMPAFHLLQNTVAQIEKYTGLKMSYLPVSIRTSFGCPMNCRYCGGVSTWNDYHYKPKEYLEREIQYFKDEIGDKGKILFFADELFTYKKEHVKDVVEIFKTRGLKIEGLFAHSQLFTDEIAGMIKEICNTVVFGAENCCDDILFMANKNQTFESLLKAVSIAKKRKLNVSLEWMVGLPGENVETAAKNINMLYSLLVTRKVDDINTYVFCPYPNSDFVKNCNKYGLTVHDSVDDMLEEGFPTHSLEDLTSNQIFVYFLMTQLAIKMAYADREQFGERFVPEECNMDRIKEIFEKIGENRTC